MDMQASAILNVTHELELEIMLYINERLFRNGNITLEMYDKAKDNILKT